MEERMTSRRASALLLALMALLAGCRESEPVIPIETKGPEPGTAQPPASRPAPPVFLTKMKHPGAAFFAVESIGVVQLRDGLFTPLPGVHGMVRGLALGRDGLIVSNHSGVYQLSGEGFSRRLKLGEYSKPGSVMDLVLAHSGTLWTLGGSGVGRYDGKGWTLFDKTKFGNARLLRSVAVDDDDHVWVSTSEILYRQEGDGWTAVDTSEQVGPRPFFQHLSRGLDGAIYASYASGLLRCVAADCRALAGIKERPDVFAVAADRRLLLVNRGNHVTVRSPHGERTVIDPAEAGYRAGVVRFATADAAGRFWLATDLGVVILDEEYHAVQWQPGQVKELAGQVQTILVGGEGPGLPVVGAEVKGTVKGRVLRSGVPVAAATVELCARPSQAHPDAPCTASVFKQTATTDAHGMFNLPDVPVGSYRFAIKAGRKWVITIGGDCCTHLSHDKVFEVGTINLH
jgi:hypothetical protein